MKSIGSLRFSSAQSLRSGRRRWWESRAGKLSRRLTRCWNRELQQDPSVRDETNNESIQDRRKRGSFQERQKREQMQLKKQKSRKSDRNLKECKERKESVAEVHNEGFIFDEEKNPCKVIIAKETMSSVVLSESGIVVQEFKMPVVIGEVKNPTLTVETNTNDRKTDLLVFEKQDPGLDVSADSAVDVDNFESNKWGQGSDGGGCAGISLEEQCRESTEFVDSSDRPLDDCDINQTKTIVADETKLKQQGNTVWIQKTDQETEVTRSQNNDDVMNETKGKREPTKEGHKLFESNLSQQNLGNEKELHDIQLSEEEIYEPKKVELAEHSKTARKKISLGTLNSSATWTNECQPTEVDPTVDIELVSRTNVDVIQSADLDFGEESESSEVVAKSELSDANVSLVSCVSPLTDSLTRSDLISRWASRSPPCLRSQPSSCLSTKW